MSRFFASPGTIMKFDYTNWKGDFSRRSITPMSIYFGSNCYHKGDQWLMVAHDLERDELRTFAMNKMSNIEVKGDANNA